MHETINGQTGDDGAEPDGVHARHHCDPSRAGLRAARVYSGKAAAFHDVHPIRAVKTTASTEARAAMPRGLVASSRRFR